MRADPAQGPEFPQPFSQGRAGRRDDIGRSRFREVKAVARRVFRDRSDVRGGALMVPYHGTAEIMPKPEFLKNSINTDKYR